MYIPRLSAKDIKAKNYTTDFSDFPTVKQPEIRKASGQWIRTDQQIQSFGSWKGEYRNTLGIW
ncbi:MAG: hypothetical protein ACLS9K_12835 [Lachnospira eligens]